MFINKIKSHIYIYKKKKKWRQLNNHNYTYICNDFELNNVNVGKATYGGLTVINFGTTEKLFIGNYCSIASGVVFILNGDHLITNISTYPFKSKILKTNEPEAVSKGNISIADDVWIGQNAIILSGVNIGQGAVIGAGAVVSKDVPPYAIVGGIPAKVIKYRFNNDTISKLLKIDYLKINSEFIENNIDLLYTSVNEEFPFDKFPMK